MGLAYGSLQCWGLTPACGLWTSTSLPYNPVFRDIPNVIMRYISQKENHRRMPLRHMQSHANKPTLTRVSCLSALTPCAFRVASLLSLPTAICCTNMAAPPKDTIFAYWRATLLVTKGHAVKILNLWKIHTPRTQICGGSTKKVLCPLCMIISSSFILQAVTQGPLFYWSQMLAASQCTKEPVIPHLY